MASLQVARCLCCTQLLLGAAHPPEHGQSCRLHAGVGLWLVVVGGRTADIGWFRTKTDTFLNDVVVMDRYS